MDENSEPSDDLRALGSHLRSWNPPFPEGRFAGRGIVICAGGARVFTNAYILAHVLRRTLRCELPIELWHFGPGEISASMSALLDALDVEVVDALPHIARASSRIRDGWQLKPFAVQQCRFAEVLLLDADQVPVRDPADAFDWPQYRETGAVFWPDMVELLESNPVWGALGLSPRRTLSFESGQLLIDKRRHWRALSVVAALNEEAERLYRMIYGDKDSFLVGWDLASAPFALVPFSPFADERCLVQRDFDGVPLFQHRTNAKWSYDGQQLDIEAFVHKDACLAALAELRALWNGRVFHPPDRSSLARRAESELVRQRHWRLEATAEESVAIELLAYNELGAGRARDRLNWWCEETAGVVTLIISDTERVTYSLTHRDTDGWVGERLRLPSLPISLRPGGDIARVRSTSPGLVDTVLQVVGFPNELGADREDLRKALALICRSEPGCLDRLVELHDQAVGDRQQELAALIGDVSSAWTAKPLGRDMALREFYRFVGRDGLD